MFATFAMLLRISFMHRNGINVRKRQIFNLILLILFNKIIYLSMKKFCTLLSMMVMFALSSQAAYYMVGDAPFGGWNPGAGVEMTQNTDGTYSYTATISGTVYFVFSDGLDSDWGVFNSEYRYGPANGNEIVNVDTWYTTQKAGDNGAYQFVGTGDEYVFTFNPFIKKFKIEGNVGEIIIDTYTVAGAPASIFGTEWDPNNTDNNMLKLEDGTYMLQKFGCELGGGTEIAFKVVGNHDWGFAWPAENMIVPVDESGLYDVKFTFNPETNEVGYELTKSGSFDVLTGELYILGEVNENGWDPSNGVKMETEDQNVFTAKVTTKGENVDENDGVGYSFFSFTTKLSESSEDWASIAAYRIGASEDGFPITEDMFGLELGMGNFGSTGSYKIPAGEYEMTVNLEAKTLVVNKIDGGVEDLINDPNKVVASKRYYNALGQEMNEANGVTIIVTNYTDGSSSAVKVIK